MRPLKNLFEQHKFARRATLVWACWLITIVVLRVTAPDVLPSINNSMVALVSAVIGILATVIGFYQWSRKQDDDPGSS